MPALQCVTATRYTRTQIQFPNDHLHMDTNHVLSIQEKSPIIDYEAFDQLVELDDEDSTEFLEGVISEWYEQAKETFKKMDERLAEKDLEEFSKRAHYLKGSSGQLGVKLLYKTCAELQHIGELWDEEKSVDRVKNISEQDALTRIPPLLEKAKGEYKEARKWFNEYLKEKGAEVEEDSEPAEELPTPKVEKTAPDPKVNGSPKIKK